MAESDSPSAVESQLKGVTAALTLVAVCTAWLEGLKLLMKRAAQKP